MQVLNSSAARPWKLEQNTSGQASRQALRASRLWKLEQNNMTKKGPFFGPQNVRKSRRAKMGLPEAPLLLLRKAALWLLGSGLDDVVVGRLGEPLHLRQLFGDPSVHPRGQCGILLIPPYDREQRNVRFGWNLGHGERAQGIVLQL